MLGSVLFMASALASYLLPTTGDLIDSRLSILGTLLGALCFLVGAALMLPAWRRAVDSVPQRRLSLDPTLGGGGAASAGAP